DEIGLTQRDDDGFRLLPDGRPLTIIVDTAGQVPEESDVLELIRDSWGRIGVRLFTKPFVRRLFRNRVFGGNSTMPLPPGLDNRLPTAESTSVELAPVDQNDREWPNWGQFWQSRGVSGQAPDTPEGKAMLELLGRWTAAIDDASRRQVWEQMLALYTDQVFTIGTVAAGA